MNNVYLVGFMGTGKSSAGKELARRLKYKFADLDELIELREKMSIPDIFAQKGEPYFRNAEKQVLKEVSGEKGFIVACGGGIVTSECNIRIMKESGTMVCLTSTVEAILERLKGCTHRPLMQVEDPRSQIENLLKIRQPFYARADISLDTTRLSVQDTACLLEEMLKPSC